MYLNSNVKPLAGDRIVTIDDLKQEAFHLKRVIKVYQVPDDNNNLRSVITHLDEHNNEYTTQVANVYLVRRRRRRHNPILKDDSTYRNFNTRPEAGDVFCYIDNEYNFHVWCDVVHKLDASLASNNSIARATAFYLIKRGDEKLELHPRRSHRHSLEK